MNVASVWNCSGLYAPASICGRMKSPSIVSSSWRCRSAHGGDRGSCGAGSPLRTACAMWGCFALGTLVPVGAVDADTSSMACIVSGARALFLPVVSVTPSRFGF